MTETATANRNDAADAVFPAINLALLDLAEERTDPARAALLELRDLLRGREWRGLLACVQATCSPATPRPATGRNGTRPWPRPPPSWDRSGSWSRMWLGRPNRARRRRTDATSPTAHGRR
jgi:hypothetical protein